MDSEINNRIKIIRKELNLTQAQFGSKIGLAQGYITNLENSRRSVSNKLIKLICATFNVREDWFLNGTGNIFENKETTIDENILNIFNQLTPEFQEYIINQMTELLKLQNKKEDF